MSEKVYYFYQTKGLVTNGYTNKKEAAKSMCQLLEKRIKDCRQESTPNQEQINLTEEQLKTCRTIVNKL